MDVLDYIFSLASREAAVNCGFGGVVVVIRRDDGPTDDTFR